MEEAAPEGSEGLSTGSEQAGTHVPRSYESEYNRTEPSTGNEAGQKGQESAHPSAETGEPSQQLSFLIPANLDSVYVDALDGVNRCMFVSNCNTGSTLRKAISHFFGRNKDCTKRIPKELWVYYCRKHYQRIRYRNAKTYPLNQMDLVLWQMRRLQAWDMAYQVTDQAPRIEFWTFALRKREEKRLKNQTGDSEESDAEQAATRDTPATPAWVKESVGGKYSTNQIIGMAQRLRDEIHNGQLGGIPEVEFLPQIPGEKSKGPKRTRRQTQPTTSPKATKRSTSEMMEDRDQVAAGFVPAASHQQSEQNLDFAGHPIEKRPRFGQSAGHLPSQGFHAPPASVFEYSRQSQSVSFSSPESTGYFDVPATSLPPRAPTVVPNMRPRAQYRRSHTPSLSQPVHPMHGYSVLPNPWHMPHPASRPEDVWPGYGQHFTGSDHQSVPSSSTHVTLPSIAAQVPENPDVRLSFFQQQSHRQFESTRGDNLNRSAHQRSVSAFIPSDRAPESTMRPTSTGAEAATQPQFGATDHFPHQYSHKAHEGFAVTQPSQYDYPPTRFGEHYEYRHSHPGYPGYQVLPPPQMMRSYEPEPRQPPSGSHFVPLNAPAAPEANQTEPRNQAQG